MQDCIDECGKGYSTQGAIKNLWGHLDRFAMELDIISKQCSSLLTSDPIPETTKEIFTDEEVSRLWENQNLEWVDSILFFLYTGFRISEMIALKTSNVDLKELTMTGGTKTAATLDFTGVAAFLVTNSLLVQCSIAVLLYFYECRPFHLFPSICDP